MLDALLNVLNGCTDIPFVELAWSHAPDDKYGVINLDNQIALDADADPVSEKMLTGFVDVFVRKPNDLSTVSDVESALKRLGIWFALNSVQFEDDTGYVHYEWTWKDTPNIVSSKLYVCRFHAHNRYIGEPQIVEIGKFVVVPTDYIPPYTENGISYTPFNSHRWKPNPSAPVLKNTVYENLYQTDVVIEDGKAYKSTGVAFTPSQINDLIAFFGNGNLINCVLLGVTASRAESIDTERITYNGGSAVWA